MIDVALRGNEIEVRRTVAGTRWKPKGRDRVAVRVRGAPLLSSTYCSSAKEHLEIERGTEVVLSGRGTAPGIHPSGLSVVGK